MSFSFCFIKVALLIMFRLARSFRQIGAAAVIGGACVNHVGGNAGLLQQSLCASTTAASSSDEREYVKVRENYALLEKKLHDIENLNGVNGLLGWDEMVMLAPGSADARSKQKSVVASLMHKMQTDADLGKLVDVLKNSDLSHLPSDYERANVRDAHRDYTLTSRKTKEMATLEAELEGKGYQTWAAARKIDKYEDFAPVLGEIVKLKREVGLATRPNMSAYDASIDQFERGMNTERLNEIFTVTRAALIPLIKNIVDSEAAKSYKVPSPLQGGDSWSVEKQTAMCKEIAQAIGFDFDKGRLDVSVHPFTGGTHPTDVRITTRYSTANWLEGVGGTIHEVGHALYEQGRNQKHDNTPVTRALSMGVHESQSLFWERMIFQSKEFSEFLLPIVKKYFPHTESVTSEQLYRFINQVEPSYIRIEADEVTYPMHIILRFEIEKDLINGVLDVNDVPDRWWSRIGESLGLERSVNAKGPLQDIHWGISALGYFPSYSLGAMIAAQLFEKVEKDIPHVRDLIKKGEFKPIKEWLNRNIHEIGSLYESPDELLLKTTGKPLDPSIYCNYLNKKYTELYSLKK